MWKIRCVMFVLLALAKVTAFAQAVGANRGHGYVSVGIGGATVTDATLLQFGVGGAWPIHHGLGIGAELNGVSDPHPSPRNNRIVLISVNGFYQFRNATASGRLVPFGTGGYSLAGGSIARYGELGLFDGVGWSSGGHGFNFGGGANYWFANQLGLRLEVRDYIFSRKYYRADLTTNPRVPHVYGFRIGLAFRRANK